MQTMNIEFRLFIIGMLLVITTMAVATQFAITDMQYEYEIIIPVVPDYGIKYIGSDNSSDGIRVLRIVPDEADSFKIVLGNVSMNYQWTYSAAFGIVNEDKFTKRITHIEVFSSAPTYLKIWLHGDRDVNANNVSNDPTSVLMYDNGTVVNGSDTVAWTLAPGDRNATTICSNTTGRKRYTNITNWDETAEVRYSLNNTDALSGISDYVWVQIELNIPSSVDTDRVRSGSIYIHFESD